MKPMFKFFLGIAAGLIALPACTVQHSFVGPRKPAEEPAPPSDPVRVETPRQTQPQEPSTLPVTFASPVPSPSPSATVTPVVDFGKPIAPDIWVQVPAGGQITIDLIAKGMSHTKDLTVTLDSLTAPSQGGSAVVLSHSTIRYVPRAALNGTVETFNYTVIDSRSVTATGKIHAEIGRYRVCGDAPPAGLKKTRVRMGVEDQFDAAGNYNEERIPTYPSVAQNWWNGAKPSVGQTTCSSLDWTGTNINCFAYFAGLKSKVENKPILAAEIEVRMKALGGQLNTDSFAIADLDYNGVRSFWSHGYDGSGTLIPASFLQSNATLTLVLDLNCLPTPTGSPKSYLSILNQRGDVGFYIQDDTSIDYVDVNLYTQ